MKAFNFPALLFGALFSLTFAITFAIAGPVFADNSGGGCFWCGGGNDGLDTFGDGSLAVLGAAGSISTATTTGGEKWATGGAGAWQGAKLTADFSDEGIEFNGITEGETYSNVDASYGFAAAGAFGGGYFGASGGFED